MKKFNSVLSVLVLAAMMIFATTANAQLRVSGTTVNNSEPTMSSTNAVLYEQMGTTSGFGSASQQFPDFSNNVIESADEFTVPAGPNWKIDSIDCAGTWSNAGPMVTMRVNIYADSGNAGIRPGARVFADSNIIPITALNNANPTFKLNTSAILPAGKYWISCMVVMNFGGGTPGQWFWSTRTTVGAPCVLRDPGNLLAGGTAWRVTTTAPDQGLMFRLRGSTVAAALIYTRCKSVNLPIPDNTPAGVSDTMNVVGIPAGSQITRLQIRMDTLLHTWVGDLRLRMTKGATTVVFCRNPGAGLNGSSGDNFIGTIFSDSARYNIDSIIPGAGSGQLSPPYTGYFRGNNNPPNTAITSTPLSTFNTMDPNGVWTLNVQDSALADLGTLRSWCLIIEYDPPVGINPIGTEIPNKYFISQNYPNPFNPVTNIKFGLPNAGNVKLVVFDILGREVATLVNEFKTAGQYVADFDASMLSSGVYFYRIESGSFVETKKMLLVK